MKTKKQIDLKYIWKTVKSINPFRIRKRKFVIVDNPNRNGICNSQLKRILDKGGKESTDALHAEFESVRNLINLIGSDEEKGLCDSSEIIEEQQRCFGANVIPPAPSQTLIALCFRALIEPLLLLLLACAVLSIGLSFYHPEEASSVDTDLEWIEGVAILAAVVIVVVVTGVNDWQKDKKFRGLQNKIESDKQVTVVRDGKVKNIPKADLVVGDIYIFKYGDLLQADGFLVQGNDVSIDESSLTGESKLINKNEHDRTLLSGTNVMEGGGRMLVTAVGINSRIGIILRLMSDGSQNEEDEKKSASSHNQDDKIKPDKTRKKSKQKHLSVLQIKLGKLALLIAYAGLAASFLTFIMLILRFCILTYIVQDEPWSNSHITYFVNSFIQAITVIVVAVPEGLPLAVTLALAFAVVRMLKDNNLVRHLNACETMGNATTICSDKTGTLTTNRMTVTECYLSGKYLKTIDEFKNVNSQVVQTLSEAIAVNTSYSSILKPSSVVGELVGQLGNKTECGLLGLVNELGQNYETYRERYPETSFHKVFCFNSERKMMTTVIRSENASGEENQFIIYTKGAPEVVLKRCSNYQDDDGSNKLLDDHAMTRIGEVVNEMSSKALRTISIALRTVAGDRADLDWDDEKSVVNDMTLICIAGIQDPVRFEVPDCIHKCQQAGVVVRMVTGDNVNTARSIAQQCGIIDPHSPFLVLESAEFNKRIRNKAGKFDQSLFDLVWPNLRVLARSSPQDKFTLVNGIVASKVSAHREIVAVTGDGTNDAPALKRADVGFAMGIQGTDVAKEACDIILTDDNFASIVKALQWGRNVYDNIAKFLQFQLTANVAAGLLSVICAAAISRVPLTAIQMLWVNLVMDTLASLALSSEKPTDALLERKPYGRKKFIISPTMLRNILGHAVYQLIVMFLILFVGPSFLDVDAWVYEVIENPHLKVPSEQFTILFNSFVLMTLFNEINARKLHSERNVFKGVFSNWIFIVVWLGCVTLQVAIVFIGGIAFSVTRLSLDLWAWSIFFGIGSLVFHQLLISLPLMPFLMVIKSIAWRHRKSSLRKKSATISLVEFDLDKSDWSDDSDNEFSTESSEVDSDELALRTTAMLWHRGLRKVKLQADTLTIFRKRLG